MSQEHKLREKLWFLFEDHASKMLAPDPDDSPWFVDIAIDMEPSEWGNFHSKWKRYLIRNKIKRVSVGGNIAEGDDTATWRNIPGFYSILDPVGLSCRCAKYFVLDIPRDLGDKILALGGLP